MVSLVITTGCQFPWAQEPPEAYREHALMKSCPGAVEVVSNASGNTVWDLMHGPSGWSVEDTPYPEAEVAISRELWPSFFTQLSPRLDETAAGANVEIAFDGWVIRRENCPAARQDTFFVGKVGSVSISAIR